MTEFNWDSFIKELEKFQKGIENIGGHSRETIIEAPACLLYTSDAADE